jgi:signal transduction histidine kinase
MGIFGSSALILIGYIYWATNGYLEQQTNATLRAEIQGLTERFSQGGVEGLDAVIRERVARDPEGGTLYLLTDPALRPIAGNLPAWPPGEVDAEGWFTFARVDSGGRRTPYRGLVLEVSDGKRLLVAGSLAGLEATRTLINRVYGLTLGIGLLLALLGGIVMSSSVTRRVDAINRASREIMAGRLHRRMPVRGINDEFDQLAENLNAMLDRIDSLIEGVRSVSDNIAHDLRTPLTRLRGRLEGLVGLPGISEDTRHELGAAIADADQLLSTFRALLRIARIEAGTHEREWVDIDLATLLGDAWELYQAVGEEKDIAVRLGPVEGHLRGDRDLVFQAVSNLLDNAIKYSPAGSEVLIEVLNAPNVVTIAVSDHGAGIPPAEREKVLGRFYRAEGAQELAPGSGLGLSLVNAIARHHGGEVLLEENAPGLRVSLRLPRSTAAGLAAMREVAFPEEEQ